MSGFEIVGLALASVINNMLTAADRVASHMREQEVEIRCMLRDLEEFQTTLDQIKLFLHSDASSEFASHLSPEIQSFFKGFSLEVFFDSTGQAAKRREALVHGRSYAPDDHSTRHISAEQDRRGLFIPDPDSWAIHGLLSQAAVQSDATTADNLNTNNYWERMRVVQEKVSQIHLPSMTMADFCYSNAMNVVEHVAIDAAQGRIKDKIRMAKVEDVDPALIGSKTGLRQFGDTFFCFTRSASLLTKQATELRNRHISWMGKHRSPITWITSYCGRKKKSGCQLLSRVRRLLWRAPVRRWRNEYSECIWASGCSRNSVFQAARTMQLGVGSLGFEGAGIVQLHPDDDDNDGHFGF